MRKHINLSLFLMAFILLLGAIFVTANNNFPSQNVVVHAEGYTLSEADALKEYAWPHTNSLRKYREATAEEIEEDSKKTTSELFDYNDKKWVIFGTRKFSYFFAIVSNTGEYLEYEKVGDKPLYVKIATDDKGNQILDANGNKTYVPVEPGDYGGLLKFIAHFNNNYINAPKDELQENLVSHDWFNNIFNELLGIVNGSFIPIIVVVATLGMIFIVIISVRFAKAETSEDRDKYKKQLIGFIVGAILTILLVIIAKLFASNADVIVDFIK